MASTDKRFTMVVGIDFSDTTDMPLDAAIELSDTRSPSPVVEGSLSSRSSSAIEAMTSLIRRRSALVQLASPCARSSAVTISRRRRPCASCCDVKIVEEFVYGRPLDGQANSFNAESAKNAEHQSTLGALRVLRV